MASTFQFQSGAIKRRCRYGHGKGRSEFQFQSGAIKRASGFTKLKEAVLFQFQSGAIKRAAFVFYGSRMIMFQFQSGAIKRIVVLDNTSPHFCFNSNLVRLSERERNDGIPYRQVSIPIWCD